MNWAAFFLVWGIAGLFASVFTAGIIYLTNDGTSYKVPFWFGIVGILSISLHVLL